MTNCLFFAIALWWRRFAKGRRCGITWRWSHFGPFPHFLFVEIRRGKLRLISYKPEHPKLKTCPPPLFAGRVAWGDAPPNNITTR